jgi:hypothetical protein
MISEEDNCEVVSEVTEEEMNNAIKSIASIFAVVSFRIYDIELRKVKLLTQ